MEAIAARKKPGLPFPVILASIAVFLFCSLFSALIFERVPHVNDEIAYLFQAKLFQSGRLYAPSPCAREFFDFPHIINNGRWYSIYPPGFPLLLAVGLIFRAPWLVNPLLAALSVLLIYFLGKEIYGPRVGLLAALLSAISPWFLVMSSTMMSHTASMFFIVFFLLFLFRALRRPTAVNGMLAGIGLGTAFLIRPYNAVLISFPFLVLYIFKMAKKVRERWRNGLGFVLSLAFLVTIMLAYNQLTNGHPLRMGYVVSYGQQVLPGFGRAAIPEFTLTPLLAAENIKEYLIALNSDLFKWPLSSFLALFPLLWITWIDHESRKKDLLLVLGFLTLLVGYSFYWGTFLLLGARLIFESAALLILLSARGISEIPPLLKRASAKATPRRVNRAIAGVLIAFTLYAFTFRLPRWVWPKDTNSPKETIGQNFSATTSHIHTAIESANIGEALVIMNLLGSPPPYFPKGGWGSGFLHNDPGLKAKIIYARAFGRDIEKLCSCYPERNIFLYFGTLDRGMLIPLKKREERIELGMPVRPPARIENSFTFVRDPADIFFSYSSEFSRFLQQLFREITPLELNGKRLEELGVWHQDRDDFQRAAFCFEAALQVENEPDIRRNLLNRLVPCYQKTGQREEAEKILAFMERVDFSERRFYGVLPERGL